MGRRTRQSNKTERCPKCFVRLSNRAAAVSHYRAHAKRDELLQRGEVGEGKRMEWALPESPRPYQMSVVWWHRWIGVEISHYTPRENYQRILTSWIGKQFRRAYGYKY